MRKAQRTSRVRQFWLVLSCCAVLLLLFYRPPAFSGSGDNEFTLLTARAILQQGTIKLDAYRDEFARQGLDFILEHHYAVHTKNGHLYNYFPLGGAILSLPLVAVYNAMGIESLALGRASNAQSFAAALTCVWLFLMMYLLARRYLRQSVAVTAAMVFLLGSPLTSVLGFSLWTHNFVAPLAMTILYLVVKAVESPPPPPNFGILVGVLLFFACLCRPTSVLLAPLVFCALFTIDKRSTFTAVAAAALPGLLFIGFSYHEFGQWLPDYYLPKRLGNPHYWTAIYGNLLSPARGFLIYVPVLFLMALSPGTLRASLAGRKVLLLFALWPVAHLLVISTFPYWWGGHSYGPRLMVDVLPVVYLFLVLFVKQLLSAPPGQARTIRIAALGVVAALSIPMHTYQGLYNPAPWQWNSAPRVGRHPELLFDWKYPQFLHTRARHARRMAEYRALLD